ncbi:MAG: hypothetical protein ACLFTK_01565 [Anaerolineales bacterium]
MRAALPPWQGTTSPLVSYHLRSARRVARRPYGVLVLVQATLLVYLLALYMLQTSTASAGEFVTLEDMLGVTWAVAFGGLSVVYIWLSMQILGRGLARAVDIIAGARARNQWDLIAITPMPRQRWYLAQLTVLGWRLFPVIRQWGIVHGLLVLMLGASFGVAQYMQWEELETCTTGNCGGWVGPDERYLTPGWYGLTILLSGGLVLVMPAIHLTLMHTVGLSISSYAVRPAIGLLYSLLVVYGLRVAMGLVYLVIVFALLAVGLPLISGQGLDMQIPSGAMLVSFLCLGLVYALFVAFFLALGIEWLPMVPLLFLAFPAPPAQHAFLFLVTWGGAALAGGLLPLWLMNILSQGTLARLNTPSQV